jgi:hypothetical protein
MDAEFVKWIATLGVGGVLAGFMFVFYRKDVRQYTELWKAATEQFITIVKENTASNARLISLIETQERNALRKQDLEAMLQSRGVVPQRREGDRRSEP